MGMPAPCLRVVLVSDESANRQGTRRTGGVYLAWMVVCHAVRHILLLVN